MNIINRRTSFPINQFLDDFFNQGIGQLVGSDHHQHIPATNILEDDYQYIVELAAPGYKKDQFEIAVDKKLLKIEASKQDVDTVQNQYLRKEFLYGSFKKELTLPPTVDSNNIEASYDNGILKIIISKKQEAIPTPAKKVDII